MRPTRAEVDLNAIAKNLRYVRACVGRKPLIMAVVKANAYGHGSLRVARYVVHNDLAQYLGVAIVEEGIALRTARILHPILAFTAPEPSQLSLYAHYGIDAAVTSIAAAKALNKIGASAGRKASVHVKIDTGMGRLGIAPADALEFFRSLRQMEHIDVRGIFTHFATSDDKDLSYTRKQLKSFTTLRRELTGLGFDIPLAHCANSAAIMRVKDAALDMVRPGIMMYGYSPTGSRPAALEPAMSIRGKIGFIKCVPAGTPISYGRRYTTSRDTLIATVAAGYADGISRRLMNQMSVLIRGRKYPVVGTICMDQFMVDLGPSAEAVEGDDVTIIGRDNTARITAWDVAKTIGTIPYEVCCAVSERVPRIYHG
jgi:alanine racemase